MTDSNLDHLHPILKPLAVEWLSRYQSTGRKAKITITWRSAVEQQVAFDIGRSNAKPGKSKHQFTLLGKPASKAFDFALYDEQGNYIADGMDDWYFEAGDVAKDLGLIWGGDWQHPDYDHIEMK